MVALVPVTLVVLDVTTALSTVGDPECGERGDACSQEYVGWFRGLAVMAIVVVVVVVVEVVTAVRRLRRRRGR